jgi:hypothetical protein
VSDSCRAWITTELVSLAKKDTFLMEDHVKSEIHSASPLILAEPSLSASLGYLLNNENCTPLSLLTNIALYYSICCPEKLAALNESKSP